MVKRKIICIDEEKCTGCGSCIPNCPEGALQVIDGKARLISDIFCDGLGACIGYCPESAITVEDRDAEPYDERKVMKNIIKAGKNTIIAHLNHLKDHGETGYLNEALAVLKERNIDVDFSKNHHRHHHHGCPSAQPMELSKSSDEECDETGKRISQLQHWPVQLHLISPDASYFKNSDMLLTADCVAYTYADFHKDYLKGKRLVIACPKLDSHPKRYVEKLVSLFDDAHIKSLTVLVMEVPCCRGLLQLAKQAREQANNKPLFSVVTIGIKGDVVKKERV